MDGLSILIILLVILALAGVLFYFIYDYIDYKNKTSDELNAAGNAITAEGKERLGNLAYVVNQVNTVNDDIYVTLSSNIINTNSNINVQSKRTDGLINSFSSLMSFSTLGSSANISLLDLPGSPGSIDLKLLKHVTATMGLTASNLTPATPAEFCSSTGCIKFPDSNGNTFVGPLTNGGQVVLDGNVRVNNNVTFGAAGAPSITTFNQNAFIFNSKYVGVGTTNPQYTLDLLGKSGDNLLKLNSTDTPAGTSPALLVNANGDLIVSQSIQIKPTTAGTTAISVFGSSTVPTGTTGIVINPSDNGKALEIKAEEGVIIKGNLRVDGLFTANGQANFNSNVTVLNPSNLSVSTINGRTPAYV